MSWTAAVTKAPWLRNTVLVVAWVQIALVVIIELFLARDMFSSEQMGRSIAQAVGLVFAVPVALFTVPALILAIMRRWLMVALVLALLAIPAAFAIIATL